jgi:hypothetical protein
VLASRLDLPVQNFLFIVSKTITYAVPSRWTHTLLIVLLTIALLTRGCLLGTAGGRSGLVDLIK